MSQALTTTPNTSLRPLILAGGLSSRMGHPKHLLQLPNGVPLYIHVLQLLRDAIPSVSVAYISLRKQSDSIQPSRAMWESLGVSLQIIYDEGMDDDDDAAKSYQDAADSKSTSLGPAAGMLAAHKHDPHATFLVVACDFPLMELETIERLITNYQPPVTCYRNQEGFCEPLLGIWSPRALAQLAENAESGSMSPSRVVRQLCGLTIDPPTGCERWLFNTNTTEGWQQAMQRWQHRQICSTSTSL